MQARRSLALHGGSDGRFGPAPLAATAEGARSSAGEHYVDIVGVTGSIPVAPTTQFVGIELGVAHASFDRKLRVFSRSAVSLITSQDSKFAPKAGSVSAVQNPVPGLVEPDAGWMSDITMPGY